MPQEANGQTFYILTITKAVIALMLAGTLCFMLATGKPIPEELIQVFLAVGTAYFSVSTAAYYQASKKKVAQAATRVYLGGERDDRD